MGGVNQDLLAQLAPAHAPAAAPWWPLAPGWWAVLALVLLLALAGWAYVVYRRRQPLRRVRVIALAELEHIAQSKSDDAAFARDLEGLLRRYAVTRFGRSAVARLNGDAWLAFLAAHGATALGGPAGAQMLQVAFGGRGQADRTAWLDAARGFLKDRKA